MDFVFQPLSGELVDSAWQLSLQAGWEQTPDDWRRLTRLPSSGVWVWLDGGEVRGSYSLVGFGTDLAWVGMVLVHKESRGRGVGKAVFQAALAEAQLRKFSVLGLDATDMGEPIYLKAGFQTVGTIERWRGVLQVRPQTGPDLSHGISPEILRFDLQAAGVDRSPLLQDLADSGATFLAAARDGQISGYAVLRPSRTATYLGPVVVSSHEDFIMLLDAVARIADGSVVICDVLKSAAHQCLLDYGLTAARYLKRMTLPFESGCLTTEKLWCGAGFEFG